MVYVPPPGAELPRPIPLEAGDVARLRVAYQLARADVARLRQGSVFQGAFPAAQAHGLVRGSIEFAVYVGAYLDALARVYPTGVPVDERGMISPERERRRTPSPFTV